jgi:hypothetical protein
MRRAWSRSLAATVASAIALVAVVAIAPTAARATRARRCRERGDRGDDDDTRLPRGRGRAASGRRRDPDGGGSRRTRPPHGRQLARAGRAAARRDLFLENGHGNPRRVPPRARLGRIELHLPAVRHGPAPALALARLRPSASDRAASSVSEGGRHALDPHVLEHVSANFAVDRSCLARRGVCQDASVYFATELDPTRRR